MIIFDLGRNNFQPADVFFGAFFGCLFAVALLMILELSNLVNVGWLWVFAPLIVPIAQLIFVLVGISRDGFK